jgi:hypothetical protein
MEDSVAALIKKHIESVIHHVVSLAALIALLEGKHQISAKHMQAVRTYVVTKCDGHVKGGMSMASDFYGYPHPAYATGNVNQGVQTSEISWARNEARPALGPVQMGGATKSSDKDISKLVKEQLKTVGATASKGVVPGLTEVIELHLKCFADDLKKNAPLTVKKVEKILKKRAHATFQ